MAPISSGSSTWTSSGLPFSFVSMATGMGPSSSGSQTTVASVVTSTLLAGLGFGGGVISSLPSNLWPTQATSRPTSPPPARPSTPHAAPKGPEADGPSEETPAPRDGGAEEKDKEKEKEEGEEGEDEAGEYKKKKSRNGPDDVVKEQPGVTATTIASATTTAAVAPGNGTEQGRPTTPGVIPAGVTPSTQEDVAGAAGTDTEPTAAPTQEPGNDTAEMQIPQDPTLSTTTPGDDKEQWPFSVHIGERLSPVCHADSILNPPPRQHAPRSKYPRSYILNNPRFVVLLAFFLYILFFFAL